MGMTKSLSETNEGNVEGESFHDSRDSITFLGRLTESKSG